MSKYKKIVLTFLVLLLFYPGYAFSIPAFPGAEGFGANSIGGRGGKIIKVTNLNDHGPGSLREAVEATPRHYANNSPEYETLDQYIARKSAGDTKPRHYANASWKNETDETYTNRLEAAGHRIIVFEVSGIINLEAELKISYPYMTIAGETSPGGILITGYGTVIRDSHDIIIRHMRFRAGSHRVVYERDVNGDIVYYDRSGTRPSGGGVNCAWGNKVAGKFSNPNTDPIPNVLRKSGYSPCEETNNNLDIYPYVGADPSGVRSFIVLGKKWGSVINPYNIIIDHSSFSWAIDQVLSLTGGVIDTTIQWSVVSEGLSAAGHDEGPHSKGFHIDGKYREDTSISMHHNYIAHSTDRMPIIYNPPENTPNGNTFVVDGVNNISYDWYGGLAPWVEGVDPKTNWVQNYAKQGVNSLSFSKELAISGKTPLVPTVYVLGNIGSTRLDQSAPQWNVGLSYRDVIAPTTLQALSPWPAPAVTTAVMSDDVADCILTGIGATAPVRDSVDARVVADFAAGTGTIINNVRFPNDFPTFQNLPVPSDTDNDGMADSWETTAGMNVGINDSALDKDGDGYTNIEEYLHHLSAKSYTYNTTCMPVLDNDTTPPLAPTNLRIN